MRAGLRLGCALMAMLLPIACLTRATALSLGQRIPADMLLALGAWVLVAIVLGAAVLLHRGWRRVAACVGCAACGLVLGASAGDPFLIAVPLAMAPMALCTLAFDAPRADEAEAA